MRSSSILRDLSFTARKLRNLFNSQVSARNLTMARARTLILLAEAGPLSQSKLAQELEVEQATVVRLVDGMEKHGLVARVPDPHDRRVRKIALTNVAKPHLDDVEAIMATIRASVLREIDKGDLEVFQKVLTQIAKNIDVQAD